ncbi:MAG: hypothetical protein LWY06_08080 [Firmicutes bacterium]|nr:hypothetical protein [Bacillota bacterium]
MSSRQNWKRIVFFVILMTISVAVFEIVFLYDFSAKSAEEITEPQTIELWLFLLISFLAFIPCAALGYGKVNALWGVFPPVVLNSITWYIFLDNLRRHGVFETTSKSGIYVYAAGVAVLSGVFGIIFTLLAKKAFDFLIIEKSDEDEEESGKSVAGKNEPQIDLKEETAKTDIKDNTKSE